MEKDYSLLGFLKKGGKYALGLFLVVIISKFISHTVFGVKTTEELLSDVRRQNSSSLKKEMSTAELLMLVSDSINKKGPIVIDSLTTFLNTSTFQGNVFYYNYLLKIDTSKYNMNVLKKNLKKEIFDTFINTSVCKEFKEKKVTIIYHYKNSKDDFLFELIFAPEKYE